MTKTALITGAATRIGAAIARELHAKEYAVIIHYHNSASKAASLVTELNTKRERSALSIQADLLKVESFDALIQEAVAFNGELSALINNASSFYPTLVGKTSHDDWQDLMGTNIRAPYFLGQASAPFLRLSSGAIINLVDIHALRPKKNYAVYSIAKAASAMMVKSLARELAPDVRVNGVAPGVILWPEDELTVAHKEQILSRIPLQKAGMQEDIATTVRFLLCEGTYITGQILSVDGGRTVQQ